MSDLTYYQRNRDVKLNRAKDYNKSDKKRLREEARDKYRNFSEEDKNKKREYGKRLKEYQENRVKNALLLLISSF